MRHFLKLCFARDIVTRAGFTALPVGTLLMVINHGDVILTGQIETIRLFKIILTFLVPYTVSTMSSVSTILSMRRE